MGDANHQGSPLCMKRSKTDFYFIFVLIVTCSVWIYGVITGFSSPHIHNPEDLELESSAYIEKIILESKTGYKEKQETVSQVIELSFTWSIIGIVFGIACAIIFLRLQRYQTEFCTHLGVVASFFIISGLIIENYYIIKKFNNSDTGRFLYIYKSITGRQKVLDDDDTSTICKFNYDTESAISNKTEDLFYEQCTPRTLDWIIQVVLPIFVNTAMILYYIFALLCMRAGLTFQEIAVVAENMYRVFFSFKRIILLKIFIHVLQTIVLFMSARVVLGLGVTTLSLICFVSGLFLINFISYYGMMIVAQMTAAWHWAKHEEKIPEKLMFRSMMTVSRYHIGTVVFNATVILPVLFAFFAAFSTKIKTNRQTYCIHFWLIIYLIFNINEYSIAATAITGQNSIEGIKTVYRTLTKNSKLSISFIFIYGCTITFVAIVIGLLSALPLVFFSNSKLGMLMITSVAITFYAIILHPVMMALRSIEKANLLCTIEESDRVDEEYGQPMMVI